MSRFRDKLVKMIRDAGSKFDEYSISPKIRQILLHWSYELTEKDFLMSCQRIKMNYYWFNRQEILQKSKENIRKKKLLSIVHKTKKLQNKIQEGVVKTCHKKKDKIKEYQRKRYQNWFSIKKRR